jgi:chloramphenicol 3-O phosphotransferase
LGIFNAEFVGFHWSGMSGIIFLHGPSSSGKSTLARAVQAKSDGLFWHYSIDHLRDSGVVPMSRIRSGDFRWSDHRAAFFEGYHRSIAALADAGNNVIVEHILDTPGWHERLQELLAAHRVLFVGLHVALAELNRREATRGDREMGSAEADFHSIHKGLRYDLELDTGGALEGNVDRVLAAWAKPPARSMFFEPGIVPDVEVR